MTTLQRTKRRKYDGPSPEEVLVNDLIELMESSDTPPWRKEWTAVNGGHRNLITGSLYCGQNPLLLEIGMLKNPRRTLPLWIGASQARKFGWFPRKGSKSTRIVRPQLNQYDKKDADGKVVVGDDGNAVQSSWVSYKIVPVFNVADLDSKDEAAADALQARIDTWINPDAKEPPARIELAEQQLERWEVKRQDSESHAFYNPAADVIGTPPPARFTDREAFIATWAHECIHSTGHEKRLNRKFGARGSKGYAREELVAELGAVLTCYRLEVGSCMTNHAAYLKHWVEMLRDDPKCLMKVLSDAKKAADLIAPETTIDVPCSAD